MMYAQILVMMQRNVNMSILYEMLMFMLMFNSAIRYCIPVFSHLHKCITQSQGMHIFIYCSIALLCNRLYKLKMSNKSA